MNTTKNIKFEQILDALMDDDADFPIHYFNHFSDITPANLRALRTIWNQITPQRMIRLFENLEVLFEANYILDFSDIALLGLTDANSAVRISAIRLLDDRANRLFIPPLITLLENDPEIGVRAEAASALGKFIYYGELEEIPEGNFHQVEEVLLRVLKSEEHEFVRQKALEAMGYSSREEIPPIIMNAYQAVDTNWLTSAIKAMGRSADDIWEDKVISALTHPNPLIQKEAIHAAGELEIKSARKLLLKWIISGNLDEEIWVASIWALSKIGGDEIEPVFQKLLEKAESDDEYSFLEEAIENLQLTNGILPELDLFDIQDPESFKLREYSPDEEIDLDDFEESWIDDLEESLEEQLEEIDDDEDEEYEE